MKKSKSKKKISTKSGESKSGTFYYMGDQIISPSIHPNSFRGDAQ